MGVPVRFPAAGYGQRGLHYGCQSQGVWGSITKIAIVEIGSHIEIRSRDFHGGDVDKDELAVRRILAVTMKRGMSSCRQRLWVYPAFTMKI